MLNKNLHTGTRILVFILSAAMVLAYYFPLWDIALGAPQYPEGLSLQIWLNRMTGDLDTINGLNHYIGMQKIHPESFKELVYMPYIIGSLIGLGLLTALINKKYMLLAFMIVLVGAGVVGTIDFYLWEYDYGHNLDPHAAIIVPGMSYQPPLIGSKQLLNFTAISWPGIGGWAIIGAGFGILFLSIYELFKK